MKRVALLAILLFALSHTTSLASRDPIANAISDKLRTKEERELDADRKPAEMLKFAGIKEGSRVMDIIPAKGYFTHIFAKVVGDKGHVYAYSPIEVDAFMKKAAPNVEITKLFSAYPNVTVLNAPINSLSSPEPLDVVWISQNYHDYYNDFFKPADVAVINKAVFTALKPGGLYIILDHSAKAGAPLTTTKELHRIDEALVKKQVLLAGFEFVEESNVLRNSKDARDKGVFDPSIRHKTDQFILKFRKPTPKKVAK